MNRRGFLGTILAAGVAPGLMLHARAMPVRVLEAPIIIQSPSFPSLSEIVARTIRERSRTLAENITRNNILLASLAAQGYLPTTGGLVIRMPDLYP